MLQETSYGVMMMLSGALLTLCCMACALASVCWAEDFHPERTRLIDYYPRGNPTNFLFRGNMPVINHTFAYSSVLSTMASVAKSHNLSLPKNFSLIDVSYLNIFEEADLKVEEDFFRSNPSLGQFHNWVIAGSIFPPPQHDEEIIKALVKEYVEELSFDKLPKLMTFFRDLLTGKGPVVIYGHCEAGTDRTGEVSGAYYMRYLNMTFLDAVSIDNHIQSRDMYTVSRNAMQWYCFYLKFVQNFSQLKCQV